MRLGLVCTVLSLLLHGGLLHAESIITENLRIPMAAAGPEGLEAILVKPSDPGRHPLVVLSHGSPRAASDRPGMKARGMLSQALEFARRGFVAVAVLRRGYGSSPGGWAEGYGPCANANYTKAGRAGAADLKATIAVLSRRDDVDASKIVAVGVSAGGFATVALTADPPPGLVAAISFAGGRGSSGPDDVCDEAALVQAFQTFGETSRVPMLWVYAQNDHFFYPALAKRLFDAFETAGGRATFIHAQSFGEEGHFLFSAGGRTVWVPIVDMFLKKEGFAMSESAKSDEPSLKPPRQLGAKGRIDFQTYLDSASHKAFAVTPGGGYAWRTGRNTQREASEAAISNCEAISHSACQLYAIDDSYAQNGAKDR